jgi:hypothetical protein
MWAATGGLESGGAGAHDTMARKMVHPTLLLELAHDGIDPGIACAALLPGPEELLVLVPLDLRPTHFPSCCCI